MKTAEWLAGYDAGKANKPMIVPLAMCLADALEWSTGYLIGQRDGRDAEIMDELEHSFRPVG